MDFFSTYALNVHAIPMFLVGIVTLGLGILVYRSNRQAATHRHFFMLCTSSALWLIGTSIGLCMTTPDEALVWFKLDSVGVMYISVTFYAFSSEFLQLKRSRSIWLGYGLATSLVLAVILRQDFITGVYHYWWGYFPRYGPASIPFFLLFFIYMAAAFIAYVRAYRTTTTPIKRQQIKYVLSAFLIAYLASSDFLLALGYEVYPWGYIPVLFEAIVVTTAILRYQLLDAALFVSMSATYVPLIPFTFVLIFLADVLRDLPPTTLASTLVLTTVLFTIVYVTIQPRLQSSLNKALFPSRYDAYHTLTRFSQAMVMNPDLSNLGTEIVRTLQAVMKIEMVSLFLFEKAQGHYQLKTSHGLAEDHIPPIPLTSHQSFADFLLLRNAPIVREELEHETAKPNDGAAAIVIETLATMQSEVCLPFVNKGHLVGFVNLGYKPSLTFYSQDELDLLRSLANSAAIALDNAMLYEDWKRSQLLVRRADRLRSLETIAGGFAHEIRNPLTTIKTFVQLAPSRKNDPEFMESFGAVVADDLARIERLIDEILDYARYMKPKFSLESLNEIVSSCLHFMEIKASSLNVSLEKHLTEQLPHSMVDRQQIKQVLMNLILNAIDAMKTRGGRLTVSTRPLTRLDGTRCIQIQVSDTGCGIAPEDLPHIFDPFFTTKHESAEHAGTGLGLSIVHQIIQEHSGTIEAHSTVGQGTTFILTLPEQSEQDSSKPTTGQTWPGKLLPFPNLPPILQRPTGTYGP